MVPAQAGVDRVELGIREVRAGGPRAGGGGPSWRTAPRRRSAWSPRRRGWTGQGIHLRPGPQVVPAQAGVDRPSTGPSSTASSGPRAGGGGPTLVTSLRTLMTWSPRRRGWTALQRHAQRPRVVVPAQAGVDRTPSAPRWAGTGGPRAGGGGPSSARGMHPPARWSPRRRGWTGLHRPQGSRRGVVPAQAGVDRSSRRVARLLPRGPRAGGGGPAPSPRTTTPRPWSPRRRGWTAAREGGPPLGCVVPAQAGVDRCPEPVSTLTRSGPRAGGGGPQTRVVEVQDIRWSPRRRGWTAQRVLFALGYGVVPAQAGVDRRSNSVDVARKRGPRAGGGGPPLLTGRVVLDQWSPRRRGWTGDGDNLLRRGAVVPAQAGVDRWKGRTPGRSSGGPRAGGGGPMRCGWAFV